MKKQATYQVDVSKILDLMAEKNIKRTKLADQLNVNDRTVRNWINLGKDVQFHNIINMGKVLEVEWTELLYDAGDRNNLLENVRKAYIEDFLEESRKDLPYQLELSIEQQFNFIESAWDSRGFPKRKQSNLWTNKTIIKIFKALDQAILIHGLEGSGKTTMLLEIMETLLAEAKQDYDAPVPVVFYLSTWSMERNFLESWLVTELNLLYAVPYEVGKNFVENGKILPLFEDLDRVPLKHRSDCIDAINIYREKQTKMHGRVPMVVCSRTTHLQEIDSKLNLRGEILVKSPTQNELDKFLQAAGDGFTKFLDIEKQDESYKEIPKTPFLLATIFQAYHATTQKQRLSTIESINMEAIRIYVNAMFENTEATKNYAYVETMNWLSHLAQQLKKNNQNIFYLERIQPNYLSQRLSRITTLLPMMLSGLIFGIVFGWGVQTAFDEHYELLIGGLFGLFGLLASLTFWMVGIGHEIQPVEKLHWSWEGILKNAIDRLLGTLLLIVIFILFGIFFGNVKFGIIMALLVSTGFFLFYELPEQKVEKIKKTNEGIKRALIHCLCSALLGAIIMAIIPGFIFESNLAIPIVSAFGLFLGLLNGGHFCIQHFILRSMLWYKKYTPWDFVTFLNYSVKCSVMYKIGGGYKFKHGLFMDYFAELNIKK